VVIGFANVAGQRQRFQNARNGTLVQPQTPSQFSRGHRTLGYGQQAQHIQAVVQRLQAFTSFYQGFGSHNPIMHNAHNLRNERASEKQSHLKARRTRELSKEQFLLDAPCKTR
jgi:hypothetical protein